MPLYAVRSGSVALSAATAKTAIELNLGSTITAKLNYVDWSFDGVSATATPVLVELITYTTTGTGSAATPRPIGEDGRASIVTAKTTMTVEGTGSVTTIWDVWTPPTSGERFFFPLGQEFALAVSKSYGLRFTAPATVNVRANVFFTE